jgi:hypothetical protein
MTPFPSSAVHVVQDSADQLRIIFPPNWALARWWVLFAVCWSLLGLFFKPEQWRFNLVVSVLCLAPALVMLTSREIDVLSRTEGTLKMDNCFVFHHTRQTLPLKSVQQAVVATDEAGGHVLSYVMGSGQEFNTDIGWMPRDGYYTTAMAINNFLAGITTEIGTETGAVPPPPEPPDWVKKSDTKADAQQKAYQERLANDKRQR